MSSEATNCYIFGGADAEGNCLLTSQLGFKHRGFGAPMNFKRAAFAHDGKKPLDETAGPQNPEETKLLSGDKVSMVRANTPNAKGSVPQSSEPKE